MHWCSIIIRSQEDTIHMLIITELILNVMGYDLMRSNSGDFCWCFYSEQNLETINNTCIKQIRHNTSQYVTIRHNTSLPITGVHPASSQAPGHAKVRVKHTVTLNTAINSYMKCHLISFYNRTVGSIKFNEAQFEKIPQKTHKNTSAKMLISLVNMNQIFVDSQWA